MYVSLSPCGMIILGDARIMCAIDGLLNLYFNFQSTAPQSEDTSYPLSPTSTKESFTFTSTSASTSRSEVSHAGLNLHMLHVDTCLAMHAVNNRSEANFLCTLG